MRGLDPLQPGGLGAGRGEIGILGHQRNRPGSGDDRDLRVGIGCHEPVAGLKVARRELEHLPVAPRVPDEIGQKGARVMVACRRCRSARHGRTARRPQSPPDPGANRWPCTRAPVVRQSQASKSSNRSVKAVENRIGVLVLPFS